MGSRQKQKEKKKSKPCLFKPNIVAPDTAVNLSEKES